MLRASTAAHSGVRPYQSTTLTSAPWSIAKRATSIWLFVIAINSGVMPLGSVSFEVGAGGHQHPRGIDPAVTGGIQQRRHAAGNQIARPAFGKPAANDADPVSEAGN